MNTLPTALVALVPTGYGPWPLVTDTYEVDPADQFSSVTWQIDPVVVYRLTDLPRLAEEARAAGVDPEGCFITIHLRVWGPTCYVKSEEDANRFRLAWAKEFNVTVDRARVGVNSPYISEDQRTMYRQVLATA